MLPPALAPEKQGKRVFVMIKSSNLWPPARRAHPEAVGAVLRTGRIANAAWALLIAAPDEVLHKKPALCVLQRNEAAALVGEAVRQVNGGAAGRAAPKERLVGSMPEAEPREEVAVVISRRAGLACDEKRTRGVSVS